MQLPGRAGEHQRQDQGHRRRRRLRHGLRERRHRHVANVDPTADLGSDSPVSEGSPATITFTNQFDPSEADTLAGFHYAYSCSNGDLSGATYASSSTSASTTCTYADGDSDHVVKARIIDQNNGFTEYTTPVHVAERRPDDRDQRRGERRRGLGLQPDPGRGHRPRRRHGHQLHRALGRRQHRQLRLQRRPDPHLRRRRQRLRRHRRPGRRGRHLPRPRERPLGHVDNVAPTVTLTGASPVNEGSTHTYSYTTPIRAAPRPSAVTHRAATAARSPARPSTRPPAPAASTAPTPTARARTTRASTVSDGDGGSDSDSTPVTVNNVAPTVTLTRREPRQRGLDPHLPLHDHRPGRRHVSAHRRTGLRRQHALGHASTRPPAPAASTAPTPTARTRYDRRASTVVRRRRRLRHATPTRCTVNNVAPTVTLTGAEPGQRGLDPHLQLHDHRPGQPRAFSRDAQSCDGGTLSGATFSSATGAGSFDCTYADGPSSHDPSVTVSDGDGGPTPTRTTGHGRQRRPDRHPDAAPARSTRARPTPTATRPPIRAPSLHARDAPDCGDGGKLVGATLQHGTGAGSFDCTFADGPASSHDPSGHRLRRRRRHRHRDLVVTVTNVAPTVTLDRCRPGQRGLDPHLQLHDHRSGRRHRSARTHRAADGGTLSAPTLQLGHRRRQLRLHLRRRPELARQPERDRLRRRRRLDSDTFAVDGEQRRPDGRPRPASDEVDEGSTHTYSYTVTDPGTDTFTVDAGYPTAAPTARSSARRPRPPRAAASSAPSRTARPSTTSDQVTDEDGASDTDSETSSSSRRQRRPGRDRWPPDHPRTRADRTLRLGSFTDPGADTSPGTSSTGATARSTTTSRSTTARHAGISAIPSPTAPDDHTVTVDRRPTTTAPSATRDSFSVTRQQRRPDVALSGAAARQRGLTYSLTPTRSPIRAPTRSPARSCTGATATSTRYARTASRRHTFADGADDDDVSVDRRRRGRHLPRRARTTHSVHVATSPRRSPCSRHRARSTRARPTPTATRSAIRAPTPSPSTHRLRRDGTLSARPSTRPRWRQLRLHLPRRPELARPRA